MLRLVTSALVGNPHPYPRVFHRSKLILGSVRVCSHEYSYPWVKYSPNGGYSWVSMKFMSTYKYLGLCDIAGKTMNLCT